jgi:hypothetical protein
MRANLKFFMWIGAPAAHEVSFMHGVLHYTISCEAMKTRTMASPNNQIVSFFQIVPLSP